MSSDFSKRLYGLLTLIGVAIVFLAIFSFASRGIKKWNFARFLDRIQNNQAVKNATLVVGAKYEGAEKFLVTYNPEKRVHPGSTFKLFTAAAALRYLGPDFKFGTALYSARNDLIFLGSGDPTLKKEHLAEFVETIGKKRVSGNLYYDDRVFTGEKFGPGWAHDWKNQYFAVPITGLQIDDNLLAIKRIKNGTTGRFVWETHPLEQYPLVDQIIYSPHEGGFSWSSVRAEMDDSGRVILRGEADSEAEFSTSATVREPSFLTAATLKQEFVKSGLMKPTARVLPFQKNLSGASLLYEHRSKPLGEIVKEMLTYSKNNYAETLIRTLGKEVKNNGTQAYGVDVLKDFLKELGVPEYDVSAFDGSGLSPPTRVSSRALLYLFEYVNRQAWKDVFWEALPESQIDGTLKYRFEQVELQHPVIAKTGSHEFSSNLAGKIVRENGKDILFSVHIFNHSFSTQESVQHIIPIIDHIVALLDKQF